LISAVIAVVFEFIYIRVILSISTEVEEDFNKVLITEDIAEIEKAK